MLWAVVLLPGVSAAGLALAQAPPADADPYAWYRNDGLIAASDGYTVGAWTNRSTVGGDPVSARNLDNVSGTPHRLRVVLADGATSHVARCAGGADALWVPRADFGDLAGSRTVVLRARVNSAGSGFLYDSSSFAAGLTRARTYSDMWHIGTEPAGSPASAATNTGSPTVAATLATWQTHVFVVSEDGSPAAYVHYVDGAPAGSVAPATTAGLSGFIVGANVQAQLGLAVDVAEILVYDRALSDADRAAVEAYLSARWSGVSDAPEPPPAGPPFGFTRPFYSGFSGYHTFRIPALVTSPSGTVVAAADGRLVNSADVPGRIDCVVRRSLDLGATWGPPIVVSDYGSDTADTDAYPVTGSTNLQTRTSASDPALLVDRTNGRIWVLYDNGSPYNYAGFGRTIKLEMRYSDDDGATWSQRVDVEAANPGLRPLAAEAYVFDGVTHTYGTGEFIAGPGNGIQLEYGPRAGRLIFPVYWYRNNNCSLFIYSDDHGQTWKRGAICGRGTGEIQMAELPDGRLLASMRPSGAAAGYRWFSRSLDGGDTWGPMFRFDATDAHPVPDPACQGNVFRLTWATNGRSRLVHANADSTSSRTRMTVRLSYDDGDSWTLSKLIYAGSSAYSSLTRLPTGDVGLLFERDNYTAIDFARLPLEYLAGGTDRLSAYTRWSGTQFTPQELMLEIVSGPAADPDGDGRTNADEFAFGGAPKTAGPPAALGAARASDLADTGEITYPRRLDRVAQGLSYTLERSPALPGVWASAEGIEVAATPNADLITEQVRVRVALPTGDSAQAFFRVRAFYE